MQGFFRRLVSFLLAVVLIVLLARRGLVGGWCVSAMQWLLFSFGLRQSCLLLWRVKTHMHRVGVP